MGSPVSPITVFASTARTATTTSSVFRIPGGLITGGESLVSGILLVIDVTAVTATPSVTFALETSSGITADAFAAHVTSAAITDTELDTTTLMVVHPDVPNDRTNVADQGPLEGLWRVVATHADTDSITYSVTAHLLH